MTSHIYIHKFMCEIYTLLQEVPANLVTKISKKTSILLLWRTEAEMDINKLTIGN